MSIALPFNRLSVTAGNQASRVARSSSWLHKRRDVRRDVEALFQAFESPRSPEEAATIDSHPVASTSQLPPYTATEYPADINRSGSLWKGKGRALPSPDATAQRKSNDYVEEGQIKRPVSSFFSSINASESQQIDTTGPIASTSTSTSTISRPFLSTDRPPQSPVEAVHLVNISAEGHQPLESLKKLLLSLELCSRQVQIAALSACLDFPVLSPYLDWKKDNIRRARDDAYLRGAQYTRIVLDDVTFYNIWNRLWTLAGENLHLSPQIASRTLEHIISFPPPKAAKNLLPVSEEAILGKALRTLLFLAGLEDNPTLAVNVLGHLLHPYLCCAGQLGTTPRSRNKLLQAQNITNATFEVNDIVLILQDLLRSGILPSSLVNRFGLSEAILKAPSMQDDEFKHLLKQTLLRIILQYCVDHSEQRYVSRISSLLEPLTRPEAKEDRLVERDLVLLIDAAKSSVEYLRIDPLKADAVAKDLRRLLNDLERQESREKDEAHLTEVQYLMKDFFDLTLTAEAQEWQSDKLASELASLWQSIVNSKIPLLAKSLVVDPSQLVYLLQFMNTTADHIFQDLLIQTANMLSSQVEEAIRSRTPLENGFVNEVLASILACSKNSTSHKQELSAMVFKLYRIFKTSAKIPGGFSLQSQNLLPLVQTARAHGSTAPAGDHHDDEKQLLSSSSFIDHFMRSRASWKVVPHLDYTALAGALLVNGEYEASRQVLQQLFNAKEVPSLEDVEICLKVLARDHPDEASRIVDEAREEGLEAMPELA